MDLSFEILAKPYRKFVQARMRAQPEVFEHLAPLYLIADFLGRHGIIPIPRIMNWSIGTRCYQSKRLIQ